MNAGKDNNNLKCSLEPFRVIIIIKHSLLINNNIAVVGVRWKNNFEWLSAERWVCWVCFILMSRKLFMKQALFVLVLRPFESSEKTIPSCFVCRFEPINQQEVSA